MTEYIFPIRFVSPIWTGGSDSRRTDRIHETGLIGGMRWWFEAILRGLDKFACDPSTNPCTLDTRKFTEDRKKGCQHGQEICYACERELLHKHGLCPACQIFGATGWAKVFSLNVEYDNNQMLKTRPLNANCDKYLPTKNCKSRGYFLPEAWLGSANLVITPRWKMDNGSISIILGLLEFIRRNAALGAKTYSTYGVFTWSNPGSCKPPIPNANDFVGKINSLPSNSINNSYPNIRYMFFAEYGLEGKWTAQELIDLKYGLRDKLSDDDTRHYIFGEVHGNIVQGSKIKIGYYEKNNTGVIRLWGWVPDSNLVNFNRELIIKTIYDEINGQYQCNYWREFNSPRDCVKNFTDSIDFIQSLF